MGSVWAVVVAAGSGNRFGAPKQFEPLLGRRVLDWSVETARESCDGVVVVLPPDRLEPGAVAGAATRSGSVRAGLAAVPDDAAVVVVHDGARPLATSALFVRVIGAVVDGADAAIPAVPVTDTVKRVADGRVIETLARRELVAVQTPQAFAAGQLRRVHASEVEATDDAALVEAAGGSVVVVEGERSNIKITDPHDLVVAEALLKARS